MLRLSHRTYARRKRLSKWYGFCVSVLLLYFHIFKKNEQQHNNTQDYISSGSCRNQTVPHISGILETAQYLSLTNHSLVLYGSTEFNLMLGKSNHYQRYSMELSHRLRDIFVRKGSSLHIALPNLPLQQEETISIFSQRMIPTLRWLRKQVDCNRQYFSSFIASPYRYSNLLHCELVDLTYKYLRTIWNKKDIIVLQYNNSETYSYDVYDNAQTKTIIQAQSIDTWSQYLSLKQILLAQNPDCIFVLSVGSTAKVLADDLVSEGRRVIEVGNLAKDFDIFMKTLKKTCSM